MSRGVPAGEGPARRREGPPERYVWSAGLKQLIARAGSRGYSAETKPAVAGTGGKRTR